MDNVFDLMFDVLTTASEQSNDNAHTSEPIIDTFTTPEYIAKMDAVTNEIRNINPPVITEVRSTSNAYDDTNNILNWDVREQFKNECSTRSLPLFGVLKPTTNTIEGYLSNVQFHERELIKDVVPDSSIVQYRCNYGKVTHEGYTELVKTRTTNRGRKKKPKRKKRRKVQGNGTDFNSQITCIVLSTLAPPPSPDGHIVVGAKVHKIKVFRTGKLQLPGVHQSTIDDAIACTKQIVHIMNRYLHAGETDPSKHTELINMNPVMKNYKFVVNLPSKHIIDLNTLREILILERSTRSSAIQLSPHPVIFTIRYTRQETKLSIKMITPIPGNVLKKTRINIFMRGKVNILGAFHFHVTMQIYEYLHYLFDTHFRELIVPEGTLNATPYDQMIMSAICTENIEQLSRAEADAIVNEFINWRPVSIHFTDEEYDIVLRILEYFGIE
jgi:hypothetical protein